MADDSNAEAGQEPESGPSDVKLSYRNLVWACAPLAVLIAVLAERFPSRDFVILSVSILAGGYLWKIPPFEIGPRPGLRNGFIATTIDRMRSACLATAGWAGVGGVFGAFGGAAKAGLTGHGQIPDAAGYGATWGTLVLGLVGSVAWTMTRVINDAKFLKSLSGKTGRGPTDH